MQHTFNQANRWDKADQTQEDRVMESGYDTNYGHHKAGNGNSDAKQPSQYEANDSQPDKPVRGIKLGGSILHFCSPCLGGGG